MQFAIWPGRTSATWCCTYRHFAGGHTLAASYYPEGTIITYSFSKWLGLGLAGFRIGAVVTSPEIVAKLADAPPNCLGSNIVAQRAAIAGLRLRGPWLTALRLASGQSSQPGDCRARGRGRRTRTMCARD